MPYISPKNRWQDIRALGRAKFVWRYGVLGWGVTTGAIWSMVIAGMEGWSKLPILLAIGVPVFALGGYAWGRIMWRLNEISRAGAKD